MNFFQFKLFYLIDFPISFTYVKIVKVLKVACVGWDETFKVKMEVLQLGRP